MSFVAKQVFAKRDPRKSNFRTGQERGGWYALNPGGKPQMEIPISAARLRIHNCWVGNGPSNSFRSDQCQSRTNSIQVLFQNFPNYLLVCANGGGVRRFNGSCVMLAPSW